MTETTIQLNLRETWPGSSLSLTPHPHPPATRGHQFSAIILIQYCPISSVLFLLTTDCSSGPAFLTSWPLLRSTMGSLMLSPCKFSESLPATQPTLSLYFLNLVSNMALWLTSFVTIFPVWIGFHASSLQRLAHEWAAFRSCLL